MPFLPVPGRCPVVPTGNNSAPVVEPRSSEVPALCVKVPMASAPLNVADAPVKVPVVVGDAVSIIAPVPVVPLDRLEAAICVPLIWYCEPDERFRLPVICGVASVGLAAITRLPLPVTVQFADVGGKVEPELLQSALFVVTEAKPMVPVVVMVPPVTPLLVAMLLTLPPPPPPPQTLFVPLTTPAELICRHCVMAVWPPTTRSLALKV